MDSSITSLIDLMVNSSLAVFAISTWYIAREEKKARTLFKISIALGNNPLLSIVEIVIDLRDTTLLNKNTVVKHIKPKDIARIERKIKKLAKLDFIRDLSVAAFPIFVVLRLYFLLLTLA